MRKQPTLTLVVTGKLVIKDQLLHPRAQKGSQYDRQGFTCSLQITRHERIQVGGSDTNTGVILTQHQLAALYKKYRFIGGVHRHNTNFGLIRG